MHSRITFYVYAKIGQVNGGGRLPLNPPLVARKGHRGAIAPKLPSCPKQICLKFFRLHLRLMYSRMGTKQSKNFYAHSACSIVLYPYFHSSGAASDCDG